MKQLIVDTIIDALIQLFAEFYRTDTGWSLSSESEEKLRNKLKVYFA